MTGERWARDRINEALGIINYLVRPLLAAVRPLRGIAYARYIDERDYRVALLEVGLPRSPPLVMVLGVVTERSRPLSPSRVLSRLRRLLRARLRYGPPQADVIYYLLLADGSRLTSGAEKLARRLRGARRQRGDVFYVGPWRGVRSELGRYLTKRLQELLRRVAGKRLYGGLEHLPLVLLKLAEAVTTVPETLKTQALRAAM